VTAVIVAAVIYSGGKISGKVSQALAAILVVALATISILAVVAGDTVGSAASPGSGIGPILQGSALVFFAFVGWELLSFTTEEFKNPRRDFPLAVAISYAIVVLLYLLIAYAVQRTLLPADPLVASAPFVALIGTTGIRHAQAVIGVLGYVIALSNVVGVVWAFSRLLFASSREGLMPARLARLSERTNVPGISVAVVLVSFLLFAVLQLAGVVPLDLLFKLAGACFLAAYILACVSFLRIGRGAASRLIAVLALAVSALILYGFGYLVVYPVALYAVSYLLVGLRGGAEGASETT
jgi:amino acid efflux transporter